MLLLNYSMKYYNQIDIMPIFQSINLNFMIFSGLILLDESSLYTNWELAKFFLSSCIIASGIYVLTMKQSVIVIDKEASVTN